MEKPCSVNIFMDKKCILTVHLKLTVTRYEEYLTGLE